MEKDFPEYIDNIAASLQDEGIGKLAARVGRLGKFRISHQGDWHFYRSEGWPYYYF